MLRLKGRPVSPGAALGTAALLRPPFMLPSPSPEIVLRLEKARGDTPFERVDLVLISPDVAGALAVSVLWARIVAIVSAEAPRADLPVNAGGIPILAGVEGLFEKVSDHELVLVDGDRGFMLVDPDGMALAAFQAERERLSPRRRIYLDSQHQVARTLDGRELRVSGEVDTLTDVEIAVQNGADALFVGRDAVLLPSPEHSDEEQRETLLTLIAFAGGKPVTLEMDLASLSLSAVMQAACAGELTSAVRADRDKGEDEDDGEYVHEYEDDRYREYLAETTEGLVEADVDFAVPRRAVLVPIGIVPAAAFEGLRADRIIVHAGEADLRDDWLAEAATWASGAMVPLELRISEASPIRVRNAVGMGCAGLIVPAGAVREVKETVRGLNAWECRDALFRPENEQ